MRFCIVTFRSVTPAQRAELLLKKEGYFCQLYRTPRRLQDQGCGYSIRISVKDVQACLELLHDSDVPYGKIYLLRGNYEIEEMIL